MGTGAMTAATQIIALPPLGPALDRATGSGLSTIEACSMLFPPGRLPQHPMTRALLAMTRAPLLMTTPHAPPLLRMSLPGLPTPRPSGASMLLPGMVVLHHEPPTPLPPGTTATGRGRERGIENVSHLRLARAWLPIPPTPRTLMNGPTAEIGARIFGFVLFCFVLCGGHLISWCLSPFFWVSTSLSLPLLAPSLSTFLVFSYNTGFSHFLDKVGYVKKSEKGVLVCEWFSEIFCPVLFSSVHST